ncbi:hypothetical protein EIH07_04885 [Chryseobacterium taklimakanense]|uniref:DUF6438 domain-containing protein n=1 Tax=Chryseobacterium taklimakanense TaxID=536441 RepID=UPI000F5E79C0|nr:DUF6438 domain-containing protein [Chryseobacterium taklimakanense]AZI22422.1 hypothetical protein EIH07_04885 [Chryseobacterium taklimakanense]
MKLLLALSLGLLVTSCTVAKNNYTKIQYEAGACFGFCPMFKLTINPDRTTVIEAEHFTFGEGRSKDDFSKEKEGTFTSTIRQEDYNTLIKMLNKINIKSLNAKYGNRNVTDLPTSYLTVTFKDGTVKKVEDYGKHGTDELAELWMFLENLRKTQTWTKVK